MKAITIYIYIPCERSEYLAWEQTFKSIIMATKVKAKAKKSKASDNINTLKLRTTANNNWKNEVFGLSALIRYARNDKQGKADVMEILKAYNKKNGTKVGISQITLANVVKHATKRELTMKDGTKKSKFSFWLVILTIGRLVKEAKKEQSKKV